MLRLLFGTSRVRLTFAICAAVLSGLFTSALLGLIHAILNVRVANGWNAAMGYAALCVLMPLCRLASNLLLADLSRRVALDVRLSLSRSIVNAHYRYVERVGSHRLMAALTEDVGAITSAITALPGLCLQLIVLAGCLCYMGTLSVRLLAFVVAFLALGFGSVQIGVRKAHRHLKKARKLNDELFRNLRGLTQGVKELKLHQRRAAEFIDVQLASAAAASHQQSFLSNAYFGFAMSWAHLLFFLLTGLLLFVAPGLLHVDGATLSGYILTLLYLLVPLDAINGSIPVIAKGQVALRAIQELGLSLSAESEAPSSGGPPLPWGGLRLSDIRHAYAGEGDESGFQLKIDHLEFAPGEIVFIVGGNGSGKTTFAKLLAGLYTPDEGRMELNGILVRDSTLQRYRENFSAVFSDFHLFDTLLGVDPDTCDAAASWHLKRLQLDHKLVIAGGKLSTTNLSQGQRKRLALLTAYMEDRPVYLFDEWAADQDPQFKEFFYRALLPELKERGKTVFVISHDDFYYDAADRIVKLAEGTIVLDQSKPAAEVAGALSCR